MVISDFAIKRPIVTVTVMLALVVFGLFSLFRLDTDEFPDVVAPVVTVESATDWIPVYAPGGGEKLGVPTTIVYAAVVTTLGMWPAFQPLTFSVSDCPTETVPPQATVGSVCVGSTPFVV